MKNLKKWITSPIATVVLFAVAAGLLLFSAVGAALAVPQYISEMYGGQMEVQDIGVSLLENGERVAYRNYVDTKEGDEWDETPTPNKIGPLLSKLLAEGEEFVPGKVYPEELSVKNSGTINQWVRVTIYKYWTDAEGQKVFSEGNEKGATTPGLSPALIRLEPANLVKPDGSGDWILDTQESSQTEERTIYYYNKLLKSGETSPPLTSTLTVDELVGRKVTQTTSDDGRTIVTRFDYDGWQFCIEADVDAVQERNVEDAIRSAWGRKVLVSDGKLTLQ